MNFLGDYGHHPKRKDFVKVPSDGLPSVSGGLPKVWAVAVWMVPFPKLVARSCWKHVNRQECYKNWREREREIFGWVGVQTFWIKMLLGDSSIFGIISKKTVMNLEDPFLFFPPSGLRLFLDFHGFFHKCPKKNWKLRPQKVWKKWTVSNFRGKGLPAKSGKNLGIRKHPKGWIVSVVCCFGSTEILEV